MPLPLDWTALQCHLSQPDFHPLIHIFVALSKSTYPLPLTALCSWWIPLLRAQVCSLSSFSKVTVSHCPCPDCPPPHQFWSAAAFNPGCTWPCKVLGKQKPVFGNSLPHLCVSRAGMLGPWLPPAPVLWQRSGIEAGKAYRDERNTHTCTAALTLVLWPHLVPLSGPPCVPAGPCQESRKFGQGHEPSVL